MKSMHHKTFAVLFTMVLVLGSPVIVSAHVTPIIKLLTVKETIAHLLPNSELYVKEVELTDAQLEKLKSFGNWESHQSRYKFILSRGTDNSLERALVFMPEFSRHGTVVIAVSLDNNGKVIDAVITDIQTEIMGWVQPLLKARYMESFKGKDSGMELALDGKWKKISNDLTQSYALAIANAVKRSAQLFDQVFK